MDSTRPNTKRTFGSRGLGLLLAAALLYLLFPAAVLERDAVIYACAGLAGDIEQSTDAGHLAWGFLELGAARAGTALQPPLNPVYLLRWLSVVSGLVGGWLFFRLARRTGSGPAAAWLVTGLLMFSYSYWHYALQAESHMMATMFLIAFAGAAATHLREGSPGSALLASLFLSLATLMHQTGILLVPAFLLPALVRAADGRARIRLLAGFLGVYFLLVIVPYLGVGWFVRGLRGYGEFRDWILGLSLWGLWGQWEVTSGAAAAIGLGRSLVGSHYLLGIPWIENWAWRAVPNATWQDEMALAATIPQGIRYALLVLQTVWFAAVIVGLVRALRRLPRRGDWSDAYSGFLALWLLIYVPFIIWWAPFLGEFWLAVFVPALLLLGPYLAPDQTPRGRAGMLVPLLVAGLVLLNLLGSIRPEADPDVEPDLEALLALDAATRPGDFVLSDLDLRGRATRYVYDLDKIDLTDPQPWRTSLLPAASEGPPPAGTYDPADLLPLPRSEDPYERALGAIETALEVADREGRSVYLAMQTLTGDREAGRRWVYLLHEIRAAYELSEPVPVRGEGEWRQVTGRRPDAPYHRVNR